MIPIGDNVPSRTFPFVTYGLIALNVAVFLFELSLRPRQLDAFINQFGVTPVLLVSAIDTQAVNPRVVVSLFTSMFIHGGWAHLIGNMLFLWIFGDNVEDAVGHRRYLVFYVLGGIIAAFAQAFFDPTSRLPLVGASGAISAVLGAYLLLHPTGAVLILFPLFLFFPIIEVPAIIVLGFWFFQQLFSGFAAITFATQATGGVAWWAHIGGFVFGVIFVNAFRQRRRTLPAIYYRSAR